MVMLTHLMRYEIEDRAGRRARIADLCIDLLEDDHPPVTHIIFSLDGKRRQEKWANITEVDWKRRKIKIGDLDAAEDQSEDDKHVLLARDLMDSLVLDLLGRRTTRISDLRLLEEDGKLRLVGVDAGFLAMVRRVSRGLIGSIDKESLFDWKYVEFLRGDPGAVESGAGYRLRINRLPAGEIARLADHVPYLHAAELLNLLPDDKAAEVLQAMPLERQLQVIEELPDDEAVRLLDRMAPDMATDLLGRLELDRMRFYVSRMRRDRREKVIELLRYPENSVGGVMTNDFIKLRARLTVGEAQSLVQEHIKHLDFISLIYVVDDQSDDLLLGVISLRDLLSAAPEDILGEKIDPYVAILDPFALAAESAHRIVGGQLDGMPVVSSEGRLVGVMTIASAISQVVPASTGLRGVRVFT